MTYVLLFAILIGLISHDVHGYPKGAPKTYCKDTILPKHKDMPAQPEPSPLEKLEAKWNIDGNTVDRELTKIISTWFFLKIIIVLFSSYFIETTTERNLHSSTQTGSNATTRHFYQFTIGYSSRFMSIGKSKTFDPIQLRFSSVYSGRSHHS